MTRRPWTQRELQILRDVYATTPSTDIAERLDV